MTWLEKCKHWKKIWNTNQNINATDSIDLYDFVLTLNQWIRELDTIVVDAGSTGYVTGQALKLKSTNRYICSGGQLDMGFGLPAAIGACLGKNSINYNERTILIVGDGGFQSNIQELAVIKYLNLPIKIFVWNNNGYLSIRNTQQKFFKGNLLGCDRQHGLWIPPLKEIAKAYHIPYTKLKKLDQRNHYGKLLFPYILEAPNPSITEIICSEKQEIIPTATMKDSQSMPLSQMAPFLSQEEYEKEHY